MKIVINTQYVGIELSRAGTKRLAELQGKECYIFNVEPNYSFYKQGLALGNIDKDEKYLPWFAYTVPNPDDIIELKKEWRDMTDKEKKEYGKATREISLSFRDIKRDDPLLVQVVEELREKANGKHTNLKVVEIPDGVEWEIAESDEMREYVAEKHRTWK